MTAPHIGNTGVNDEDPESARIWVAGYVVRDPARVPSNWRSRRSLDDELVDAGRRRHQRHRHPRPDPPPARARRDARSASSPARRSPTPPTLLARVPQAPADGRRRPLRRGHHRPSRTSSRRSATKRFTVAALDLGIKAMTPHRMAERGIEVHVLPADRHRRGRARGRARRRVLLQRPRRPGHRRRTRSRCCARCSTRGIPFFGICFGNQLLGRALGFGTYKLKYGHRGINQPVQDRATGKVEVTAHNHGFAVDAPLDGRLRHPATAASRSATSASTTTSSRACGCSTCPAFSVQYHPEAAAGPHDAAYLFDRFVDLMRRDARREPA